MNRRYWYISTLWIALNMWTCAAPYREEEAAQSEVLEEFIPITQNAEEATEEAMDEPEMATESDMRLPLEQLNAFEIRTMQKLEDYADYFGIISNREYDKSLRKHAVELVVSSFVEDASVKNLLLEGEEMDMNSFFKAMSRNKFGTMTMGIKNIRIAQPLILLDEQRHKGVLTFEQHLSMEDGSTVTSTKQVDIWLIRTEKSFGDDLQWIWEPRLGNIY